MPTIVLKLTRAPSDTSVKQTPQTAGPLLRGTGDTDYLCGNCGFVIASGMGQGQRVAVDRATCSACGAETNFHLNYAVDHERRTPAANLSALTPTLADRLEAWGATFLFGMFEFLPLDCSSALGGALARRIGPFLGASKQARRNISRAFPGLSDTSAKMSPMALTEALSASISTARRTVFSDILGPLKIDAVIPITSLWRRGVRQGRTHEKRVASCRG
jgi:hypothetical protein